MWLKNTILLLSLTILLTVNQSRSATFCSQIASHINGQDSASSLPIDEILSAVQNGIMKGNIGSFVQYMAPQIYMSLLNTDEGYFSSNQSSFILERFFSSNRLMTFRFTTVHKDGLSAYATGGGTLMRKGTSEIIQIYVSFRYRAGSWVMTQFNIY